MGGEDLVIVVSRQEALGVAERQHLLGAHHQRVGKAAQQHDDAEHHVHDADALVVDAGEPFAPQIAPELEIGQDAEKGDAAECDDSEGGHDDGFMKRKRLECQPAEDRLEKCGIVEHVLRGASGVEGRPNRAGCLG